MKFTTLFLTLSLLLAACATPPSVSPTALPDTPPSDASTPTPSEEVSAQDPLLDTQWVLESFGASGAETEVIGESPLTLEFTADGQVGGHGGCNSFGGSYAVEDSSLVLGGIVSTLVACVDTALMTQEVDYLNALQTVTEFQLDGDGLTITYNDGQGILNFVSAAASPAEEEAIPTETPAPEAAIPNTPATQPIAEGEAGSEASNGVGASQNFIWNCYFCGGSQVWSFENGQATRLDLPVEINEFYDYAPATNRVLYSSPGPLIGGGPSQIAVGDLWSFDVATGQSQALFSEQVVVEAKWSSDGEQFVYVLATDTTYELRWHGPDGADTLLASDVAFTFSVSPTGDKVAFTRESNYGLPGQPGFYVVDVATGEEIMLTDTDRAGAGSIDDKPVWSPSGQSIFLPTYGTTGGPGLLRFDADGSSSDTLTFDPALSEVEWYEAEPFNPFWVSDTQFIASASIASQNAQMGGLSDLVYYQLNDTLDTIIGGSVIGRGVVIGWDVPGVSVWVQTEMGEMESIPLPTL